MATMHIRNNTFVNRGIGISFLDVLEINNQDNNATLDIRNNILMGARGAGADFRVDGSPTLTISNNLTSDDTADDEGGAGHITNEAIENVFTSGVLIDADSSAFNAGVDNGLTEDVIGVSRPQGNSFDIGAFEYIEPMPEINITLNGTSIPNGQSTPVDFGTSTRG